MSIQKELKEMSEGSIKRIPSEQRAVMEEFQKQLEKLNPMSSIKKTGDYLPEFCLTNHLGEEVCSKDILLKGSMIITFYRGGWCPYCNIELRGYQQILSDIEKLGATLVAISPEVPDKSANLTKVNNIKFPVLSDIDNTYAKKLGLVFSLSEELEAVYKQFGINLFESQGNHNKELPIPITYVVNQDGKILYHYASLDYTKRAEPSDILKYIPAKAH